MTDQALTQHSRPPSGRFPEIGGNLPAPRPSRLLKRVLGWAILLGAVAIGLTFKPRISRTFESLVPEPAREANVLYWVSPHDPSFRSDKPGTDSMGMQLVPVYAGQETPQTPVTIDPVLQEREVTTVPVENALRVRTIQTFGTVAYAEPLIGEVTLKVNAWVERLFVDYQGQAVRKGDPLFAIYAPELVAAQQEFLISLQAAELARPRPNPAEQAFAQENLQSAREKLRYWDVTDEQIDELVKAKKVQKTITFFSPFDGIVIAKTAFEGKFLEAGAMLYRIADLSKVWVNLFVYSNQIHCVYLGQGATMSLANLPDHKFEGKVIYIYPYLEPKIRAVKVRLEFENPKLLLKPDMFAQVELEPHRMGIGLNLQQQAVLDTGQRQLVYVARPNHRFEAREVRTGMELDGGKVEILSGLSEGEEVVLAPRFLIDSESRLRSVNRDFEEAPNWITSKTQDRHEGHGMSASHEGHGGENMPSGAADHTGHRMPPSSKSEKSAPGASLKGKE